MPLCGGFIRGTSRPKTSRDARRYELMKRRQEPCLCGPLIPKTAGPQVLWGTALNPAPMATGTANRQRRPPIRRKTCGFADLEGFNLWHSRSSIEPSAADGTGHCPAQTSGTSTYGSRSRRSNRRKRESATPTCDFRKTSENPQTSAASIYGGR